MAMGNPSTNWTSEDRNSMRNFGTSAYDFIATAPTSSRSLSQNTPTTSYDPLNIQSRVYHYQQQPPISTSTQSRPSNVLDHGGGGIDTRFRLLNASSNTGLVTHPPLEYRRSTSPAVTDIISPSLHGTDRYTHQTNSGVSHFSQNVSSPYLARPPSSTSTWNAEYNAPKQRTLPANKAFSHHSPQNNNMNNNTLPGKPLTAQHPQQQWAGPYYNDPRGFSLTLGDLPSSTSSGSIFSVENLVHSHRDNNEEP